MPYDNAEQNENLLFLVLREYRQHPVQHEDSIESWFKLQKVTA